MHHDTLRARYENASAPEKRAACISLAALQRHLCFENVTALSISFVEMTTAFKQVSRVGMRSGKGRIHKSLRIRSGIVCRSVDERYGAIVSEARYEVIMCDACIGCAGNVESGECTVLRGIWISNIKVL